MPCPSEHALLDYVDHKLDRDARAGLDGHIDRCPRCQSVVAELVATVHGEDEPLAESSEVVYGGRYRVDATLGSGAMGIVFAAHDRVLARNVAIKVVLQRPGTFASTETAGGTRHTTAPRRMMLEARALARLSHPNIVEVFDVGRCPEGLFIAMELVRGTTLRRWLAERTRPWRRVLAMLLQAADALAAAHRSGIVHRDFKPDNAMVSEGTLKVLDFGLALHDDSALTDGGRPMPSGGNPRLTRSGIVVGSPAYLAPECHRGATADARSDQYSFFVTLFESLCGRRPFESGAIEGLVVAKLRGIEARDVAPPRLPTWLRAAIVRGLAVEPGERFASMEAAIAELRGGLRRRRIGGAIAGAAVAIGIIAVALPSPSAPACEPETRLHPVWDAARRDEVARALNQRAPDHADDMLRAADAYAAQWIAAYGELCKLPHDDAAKREAAIACLGTRRAALDQLAAMLVDADAFLAARMRAHIGELPAIDTCTELEQGRATAEERELREQLARANVLLTGGQFDEAGALGASLAERARTAGVGDVEASARQLVGAAASERYDYTAADASLQESFMLAQRLGLEDIAASSAVRLAFVWGDGFGKPAIALEWARHAEAALVRAGRDPGQSPDLQTALGIVLNTMGREADALPHLERSLELAIDDEERAVAELNVGVALARLQRPADAAVRFQKSIALREKTLGPTHPLTYVARIDLAGALLDAGRIDEAAQVVQALIEHLDEDVPDMVRAATLSLHGDILGERGAHEEAAAAQEQALAAVERAVGPEHPDAIRQLVNVGAAYLAAHRCEDALAIAVRGRTAFEAAGLEAVPDYASLEQIEAEARRCGVERAK